MLLQTQNVCSSVGCLDNLGEGICLVCLYILMLKFIPCNCSNSILLLLILFQVIILLLAIGEGEYANERTL